MTKSGTSSRRVSAPRKRKNILIDQRKLDAAKAALGVLTETETVDAALDLVVFRAEVFDALDHVAAAGGIAVRADSSSRMIYTLDTNVVVDALRQPAELAFLKEFLNWALPQTALSSVVASELLAGARTHAARGLVHAELLAAFERRGRIIAPSAEAWAKTGILLGESGGGPTGVLSQNDLLLAHTARELGWSVITRDKDFARIRQHLKGLRVESPYPRRPIS